MRGERSNVPREARDFTERRRESEPPTTVKAIAIKDDVSSAVASKSFTKSSGSNDD